LLAAEQARTTQAIEAFLAARLEAMAEAKCPPWWLLRVAG
jgi:hypothetical protein